MAALLSSPPPQETSNTHAERRLSPSSINLQRFPGYRPPKVSPRASTSKGDQTNDTKPTELLPHYYHSKATATTRQHRTANQQDILIACLQRCIEDEHEYDLYDRSSYTINLLTIDTLALLTRTIQRLRIAYPLLFFH